MKIQLIYFFQKHKLKIFLCSLFLFFLLFIILVYHILFGIDRTEKIVFRESDEVEVLEKEEKSLDKYYVDIKGEVKIPGVYLLDVGKRVIDVIEMAGGVTKDADTSVNNLSRKISDEMVIIIYSKTQVEDFMNVKNAEEGLLDEIQKEEERGDNDALLKEEEIEPSINKNQSTEDVKESQESLNDGKISINTATKEELMTLSGIGSSKADAILSYRKEHGNFTKLEELLNVNGIGEVIYNQIKDFIKL